MLALSTSFNSIEAHKNINPAGLDLEELRVIPIRKKY